MKKLLLFCGLVFIYFNGANAQCSITNATSCQCAQSGSTNCDLLPDIEVGRPPLLVQGTSGIIEYSQYGNGVNNGLLRISVSTPNIGAGPLEIRATNVYVCGTDTFYGTAPSVCPDGITFPKNLIVQRVYHKNGATMSYYERPAGTMTYHPSHGHMHVDNWGIYSLRKSTSDPNPLNWPIYANGAKLAFCLMDYGTCSYYNGHCVDTNGTILTNSNFPNFGLGGGSYTCSAVFQGISSGYTDIYYQNLDGMWVNLPDTICNGNYYIVVNVDPLNYFLESNENNNVMAVPVTLTKQLGTAPVITAGGPTTFCTGSNVTLTSSQASNYLWSNGATTQSIIVTASGTYTVSVNTTSGCPSMSAPMQVTTNPLNVSATATPANICVQGQAQLNGSFAGDSLTTVTASFSNNNNYIIPDNNATGVESPITVSGINPATLGSPLYIQVQLNINHTYDGDLNIYLISPSGNQITLSGLRGGSGDNFTNTIFSTNAVNQIASGSAPFTGTFIPEQAFSSLTGNINGIWKLKVADVYSADTGRILNWSLQLNNIVPSSHNFQWSSNPAGFTSSISNPVAAINKTTTYTVTVTNTATGCQGSASVTVPVGSNPSVSFSGLKATYHLSDAPSSLSGLPSTGTFSGPGISGFTFNPSLAGIGNPSVTYSYTNGSGCTGSKTKSTIVYADYTCATPTGITVNNITSTSAQLNWTGATAAKFTIKYRVANSPSTQNVSITVSGAPNLTSAVLPGLTPGTKYWAWIKSKCSGVTTAFSSKVIFTTLSQPVKLTSNTSGEIGFNIYPNPANDKLLVSFSQQSSTLVTIKILNLAGQELKRIEVKKNDLTIDISELAAGAYFITFEDKNLNEGGKLKFMKQ